jgi:two-component system chemotaxis response regulator CheB
VNPIRVMVVDDSVVVRKIVTDVLSADPDIEVVGTAVNGKVALTKLEALKPELVTMDIEMPEMNGIEAVRAIRAGAGGREHSRVPIIMFSTLTERGASATLDALSAGANDYVTKPANVGSVGQSMESVREQLIPRIKALTGRPVTTGPVRAAAPVAPPPPAAPRVGPAKKPASPLLPGTVHLAPGDHHLVVRGGARGPHTELNQGPPENFCRPAVDPLFRSVVNVYDGAVLAVVLTGMGADGRNGAGEIRAGGGTVLVQDQATSVVWGMPGAISQAGYADEVLPLDRIPEAITRHLSGLVAVPGSARVAGAAR